MPSLVRSPLTLYGSFPTKYTRLRIEFQDALNSMSVAGNNDLAQSSWAV
jgi:hypothetical protein